MVDIDGDVQRTEWTADLEGIVRLAKSMSLCVSRTLKSAFVKGAYERCLW